MSDDEAALLRACEAAPGDALVRLVYADWLDEHGDPRGAYLRAESVACDAVAGGDEEAIDSWFDADAARGFDAGWLATAGVKCDVLLVSVGAEHTITVIKMVRAVSELGLAAAKGVVDAHLASKQPVLVCASRPLDEALAAAESIVYGSWPARPGFTHYRRVATASVRRAGTEPAEQSAMMTASSPGLPS